MSSSNRRGLGKRLPAKSPGTPYGTPIGKDAENKDDLSPAGSEHNSADEKEGEDDGEEEITLKTMFREMQRMNARVEKLEKNLRAVRDESSIARTPDVSARASSKKQQLRGKYPLDDAAAANPSVLAAAASAAPVPAAVQNADASVPAPERANMADAEVRVSFARVCVASSEADHGADCIDSDLPDAAVPMAELLCAAADENEPPASAVDSASAASDADFPIVPPLPAHHMDVDAEDLDDSQVVRDDHDCPPLGYMLALCKGFTKLVDLRFLLSMAFAHNRKVVYKRVEP